MGGGDGKGRGKGTQSCRHLARGRWVRLCAAFAASRSHRTLSRGWSLDMRDCDESGREVGKWKVRCGEGRWGSRGEGVYACGRGCLHLGDLHLVRVSWRARGLGGMGQLGRRWFIYDSAVRLGLLQPTRSFVAGLLPNPSTLYHHIEIGLLLRHFFQAHENLIGLSASSESSLGDIIC